MKIFLDTSSLFKLYHKEPGTLELFKFFNKNQIDGILLSEIAKLEFCSVVWKKCRKSEVNEEISRILIHKFENDSDKYSFIPVSDDLINKAKTLIDKYWEKGLRTLDSIQLASVLIVKSEIDYFFTTDKILANIASLEDVNVLS